MLFKKKNKEGEDAPKPKKSFLFWLRDNLDALVFAFFVAMFFRTFVVELYQVPSGSMTPTLMGDYAAHVDLNGDGKKDVVLFDRLSKYLYSLKMTSQQPYRLILDQENHTIIPCQIVTNEKTQSPEIQRIEISREQLKSLLRRKGIFHPVFVKSDDYWSVESPGEYLDNIENISKIKKEYSRIIISKFHYWFQKPKVGDVLMFKTPLSIYDPQKPKYIKRVVGQAGDSIDIQDHHVIRNGAVVTDHPVIANNTYYRADDFQETKVGDEDFLVFGDNSSSSWDSRYWGPVPDDHIGGKALFCFWPPSSFGFVK